MIHAPSVPPVEHCPHLCRGCLLGVRLICEPLSASVADHNDLLPTTQSSSDGNLCAPELSVAGTRAVIVRAHSKMVPICVLLNALTERHSGGVSYCRRRREGGDETRWQWRGTGRGMVNTAVRRLKTCARCFGEERDLLNDSALLCVGEGLSFGYSDAMFRRSRTFRVTVWL